MSPPPNSQTKRTEPELACKWLTSLVWLGPRRPSYSAQESHPIPNPRRLHPIPQFPIQASTFSLSSAALIPQPPFLSRHAARPVPPPITRLAPRPPLAGWPRAPASTRAPCSPIPIPIPNPTPFLSRRAAPSRHPQHHRQRQRQRRQDQREHEIRGSTSKDTVTQASTRNACALK